MFKIVPVDQNKDSEIEGKPLYLHGVKSHKVENVMKFGYTDQVWTNYVCSEQSCSRLSCSSIECARKCSDDFSLEYSKGLYLLEKFFILILANIHFEKFNH